MTCCWINCFGHAVNFAPLEIDNRLVCVGFCKKHYDFEQTIGRRRTFHRLSVKNKNCENEGCSNSAIMLIDATYVCESCLETPKKTREEIAKGWQKLLETNEIKEGSCK